MPTFAFTPEQEDAIETRGENLLVAAGAGSGKTSVLVERILSYLNAGGDINRLLALTFTNAAAADMRQKIDAALSSLLAANPGDSHLKRQAALLPQARISTIHAFCLDLLRRHYYRLDLPASFRVASELELSLLRGEVMDDFLEEEYAKLNSMLPAMADAYGGSRDDSGLVTTLMALHAYSLSRPQAGQWLADCADAFNAMQDIDTGAYAVYLDTALAFDLAVARGGLDRARELALRADLPLPWLGLLSDEMAQINLAIDSRCGFLARLERLGDIRFGRLSGGKRQFTSEQEEAAERFKDLRSATRDDVRALQKKYGARDAAGMREDLAALEPFMRELVRLVWEYDRRLGEEKRRKGLIDFADMEHLTLKLLSDGEQAAEIQAEYDEVLVDEYQDINEMQDAILRFLMRDNHFFAVGDVKQSIYRFRLAEPGLFLDKYRGYGRGEGGRRIDLNRNYRSTESIIQGVNFLFRQLMHGSVAEIEYDRAAELRAGRSVLGAPPEITLIDLDRPAADEAQALLLEGRLIARRILELKREGYNYGDMVVLLRASKNREPVIVAALGEACIPALAEGEESYADSAEIGLMLSLLQIIDNPLQDIPLAAVLRSPLFEFSVDQLVELRLAVPNGDFYRALQLTAAGEGQLAAQARGFLATLAQWRQKASELRISELLLLIYRESGYFHLLGALPDGARRQANLRALQQRAEQYEQSAYAGLFRFIRLLEDGRELGVSEKAARMQAEGNDVVRVMTIHKSKGLEFPVVFLAGLAHEFNFMDERGDIVWDRSLGLGARLADRPRRRKYGTLSHLAVSRRLHDLALAEEMRVLYVGATRARDRLLLTAAIRRADKLLAAAADMLTAADACLPLPVIATAKRPLDWLLPALLRHPDAASLRELAGRPDLPPLTETGAWCIHFLPAAALAAPAVTETAIQAVQVMVAPQLAQQVAAALDFRYAYAEACAYPAKWSVSALSRLALTAEAAEQTAVLPLPETEIADSKADIARRQQAAEAAARRGTAYHRILELMDLRQVSAEQLPSQVADMVARGFLRPDLASVVDIGRIAAFFQTPLGQRFAAADMVRRETAFTYAHQVSEDDSILVQGMLDAAFREQEGWVLLDYKTGGFGKSEAELKAAYGEQIAYYRRAIEQLWGAPVQEAYICMLDLGYNLSL
jgi:ATP-dependent helicase/nuclease subunit A